MFTGLASDIARIVALDHRSQGSRLCVESSYVQMDDGASVLHSGICLTVTQVCPGPQGVRWSTVVSPHTRSSSNAGSWQIGDGLNLERSLRAGDELGGHLVYGHVDTVATLRSVTDDGDTQRLRIDIPEDMGDVIFPRASVALDGISLTVAGVDPDHRWFEVVVIPHTLEVTTLSRARQGYRFNIEADMISRQVAALVRRMAPARGVT